MIAFFRKSSGDEVVVVIYMKSSIAFNLAKDLIVKTYKCSQIMRR